MDTYLHRFEQRAVKLRAGGQKRRGLILLASLLSGKALVVYHSMSIADSQDYVKLKTELLKPFMCTSEGFRDMFRSVKPESGESFTSFVIRVSHLLERWYGFV